MQSCEIYACSAFTWVVMTCLIYTAPGWSWWRHQMETFRVTGHLCGKPVNSPHKVQWRGALMFSLICALINGWENNGEAGDLRRHRTHYNVTVMSSNSGCRDALLSSAGVTAILVWQGFIQNSLARKYLHSKLACKRYLSLPELCHSQSCLTCIAFRTQITNYIEIKPWSVIIHQYSYFKSG